MIIASNTTNFRQSLGRMGETVAQELLVSGDWTIEARNYYSHRRGEIDIIARPPDGHILVFIEVKTRHFSSSVNPTGLDHPGQQSVHWAKQRSLKQTAMAYLATRSGGEACTLRFDLMLVDIKLNYRDLKDLLRLQDSQALRPHCLVTHITDIMGTF